MENIVQELEHVLALVERTSLIVDVNTLENPVRELVQVYWEGRERLHSAMGDFRRCAELCRRLSIMTAVDEEA